MNTLINLILFLLLSVLSKGEMRIPPATKKVDLQKTPLELYQRLKKSQSILNC